MADPTSGSWTNTITSSSSSEENICVIIRSRPLNQREIQNKEFNCLSYGRQGNQIIIQKDKNTAESFTCHGIFMGNITQPIFFNSCGILNLLNSALQGYHCCAFAYGQTGAGKTHTMIGPSLVLDCSNNDCGLLGRSLVYLYEKLEARNSPYLVKISCLELYQEQIYDLLIDERNRNSLIIREHPTEGFFVEGNEMIECSNLKIAEKVINRALKSRHIGSHDLNHRSNRSHFITEISLEIPEKQSSMDGGSSSDEFYTLMGKMTFVDLAGSERLKSTNSRGKILQETGSINSSLYVLGKVISGLSKMVDTGMTDYQKDIPYRDSKLTKLLINSLGGASRTMIISCVSEASGSLPESLRTIHFSMSAARIRNRPIRYLDPQQKLILELRDEIKRLKQENYRLRDSLSREPTRYWKQEGERGRYSLESENSQNFETEELMINNNKENKEIIRYSINSDFQSQQSQPQLTQHSSQQPSQQQQSQNRSSEDQLNSSSSNNLLPRNQQLTHISSQPNINNNLNLYNPSLSSSSSSLSRSKSQRDLPKWNNSIVLNATVKDDKFDQMARDMYQEYLKFEQKSKNITQAQMENHFPLQHPLNRLKKSKQKKTSSSKSEPRIPYIKEGSARVLTKPKGPNPYTAHLRKSKSSQKQPQRSHEIYEAYPAPQSAFPELASPQLVRPTAAAVSVQYSHSSLPAVNQRTNKKTEPQSTCDEKCPFISSTNPSQPSTLSPTKNIKSKLQKLENQLHRERRDIESNPSKATKEMWSHLETLEDEVRDMRLELQLSEQLYHLFPVNESTVNSTEEKSTKHVDHFPLPAISSHQNSSPNTNPTSESDSPMRSQSQYNPSMTTQTHDSLTYTNSQYNPSDTVRTIDSTSPLKAQTSGSTYFDTLHGEKLLETPSRKDPSPMKSTSNRDSQQKSPSAEQTVSPKKDHDHPPSLLSSTAVDDQSYLDDEFEADEYGEEEFEPL